jgi:hypothetical protein
LTVPLPGFGSAYEVKTPFHSTKPRLTPFPSIQYECDVVGVATVVARREHGISNRTSAARPVCFRSPRT